MADEIMHDAQDQASEDWRGEYADQLEKFKSPADLAKSYVSLEKAMGGRVKIPEAGDTEAMAKLYDQLGRPESPDKYTIDEKVAEGVPIDPDILAAVRGGAHKAGLNDSQVATLWGDYIGAVRAAKEKADKEEAEKNATVWTDLKAQWGEKTTKENIELAKRAVRENPLVKDMITDEMVESDPVFVAFVSALARKGMNDTLVTGAASGEEDYRPEYPDSPEMYRHGESESAKKARAWFEAKGHKY